MTFELRPETRLRVSSSVYSRPFGNELVLLDFGRGEYFALDEVGAEIWRLLAAGETLIAIAVKLASDFEVTEERALSDICAIVREMEHRSLVEAAASSASKVT